MAHNMKDRYSTVLSSVLVWPLYNGVSKEAEILV